MNALHQDAFQQSSIITLPADPLENQTLSEQATPDRTMRCRDRAFGNGVAGKM
jgi:hypothetical protein